MVLRILAALLMIAPAAMIWIGLKKTGKGQPAAGLGMFVSWGISTVRALGDLSWCMIKNTPYDGITEQQQQADTGRILAAG